MSEENALEELDGDTPPDGEQEGDDENENKEAGDKDTPPEPDPAVEARARQQGWVPESEWKGDPPRHGFRTAEEFLEHAENSPEVLTERNRALSRRLGEMEKTIKDVAQWRSKVEENAYKRAAKDIRTRMREAAKDADVEAFDALDKEMDALEEKAPKAAEVKPEDADVPPEVKEWADRNPWFTRDAAMRAFATAYHGQLMQDKPGMTLDENLSEVTEEVKRRYPEKFGNSARKAAPKVEGAGARAGRKGGKGYADLPDDAKQACDRFVKQGIYIGKDGKPLPKEKARAEYVKDYFEQE